MANTNIAQANYTLIRGPSEDRSYSGFSITPTPIKIVKKALSKFCTGVELETISNEYRRSEFTEEALLKDFESANVPNHEVVKDKFYYKAFDLAKKMLAPEFNWKPVHFADLRWYDFPLSVSAEAPFTEDQALISKIKEAHGQGLIPNSRVSFHNAYNYIFMKCRTWVHLIKDGVAKGNQYFFWITLHARSHIVSEDDPDKIRMVYGVPKLLLFTELMFLWPYFNFLRKGTTVIAWGFETLNGGFYRLSTLLDSLSYTPQTWLCLDWSQFDKLAKFSVINDVHEFIFSKLNLEEGYLPTVNYPVYTKPIPLFKAQMARLFRWTSNAVKYTPIRTFDGSEYKRTHSNIASGLMSTQLLDTWVNFIMVVTTLLEMGYDITEDVLMKLLGDDSLIALKELVLEKDYESFLKKFAEIAYRRFGSKLNVKKSLIRPTLQGCHFLGYTYDNAVPKRDYLKLLAQLYLPERNWDLPRLAARAVGICWASAGQSRLVYNVCKDIYDYTRSLGAIPNPDSLRYLEYQGLTTTELDVSAFPTIEEIQNRNLTYSTSKSKYLDPDVFLAEY